MGERSHSEPRGEITATLPPDRKTKTCYFLRDGDECFKPRKTVINSKHYHDIDSLKDQLNKVVSLPFGVRSIYTPMGRNNVRSLNDLQDEGHYVCSTYNSRASGVDLEKVRSRKPWRFARAPSRLGSTEPYKKKSSRSNTRRSQNDQVSPTQSEPSYHSKTPVTPKVIVVFKNGSPDESHKILLNRTGNYAFEKLLDDLSENFKMAVRSLYTADGDKVCMQRGSSGARFTTLGELSLTHWGRGKMAAIFGRWQVPMHFLEWTLFNFK